VTATVYDREALAWAAGFFDGEGHAGTILRASKETKRRTPRFYLVVVQYESTTLARFQRALGGLGTIHASTRRGKQTWAWQAQSFEAAQASLALLWRWLSEPKQAQASEALRRYTAIRAAMGIRQWGRRFCDFSGCGQPHRGHGLCSGHLWQQQQGRNLTAILRGQSQ
jgi:hypothetical protein